MLCTTAFSSTLQNKANNITTGRIYKSVIDKERRGDYLGKTIQVIPHITDEIKRNVKLLGNKYKFDFVITEIGGTVGDIESLPYLESIRQLKWELGRDAFIDASGCDVICFSSLDAKKTFVMT